MKEAGLSFSWAHSLPMKGREKGEKERERLMRAVPPAPLEGAGPTATEMRGLLWDVPFLILLEEDERNVETDASPAGEGTTSVSQSTDHRSNG